MKKDNFSHIELGALTNTKDMENNGIKGKFFLKEQLGLTGCEVSINTIPAGGAIPFLHSHKENEETYVFLQGNGVFYIDGQELAVKEGSMLNIRPDGVRGLKAGSEDLLYMCVQSKENSLGQATRDDGILAQEEWS